MKNFIYLLLAIGLVPHAAAAERTRPRDDGKPRRVSLKGLDPKPLPPLDEATATAEQLYMRAISTPGRESWRWYVAAARKGHQEAAGALGRRIEEKRDGGAPDPAELRQWMLDGLEKGGDRWAAYFLGMMELAEPEPDLDEARRYLVLARVPFPGMPGGEGTARVAVNVMQQRGMAPPTDDELRPRPMLLDESYRAKHQAAVQQTASARRLASYYAVTPAEEHEVDDLAQPKGWLVATEAPGDEHMREMFPDIVAENVKNVDPLKARRILRAGLAKNVPAARTKLGMWLVDGTAGPRDLAEALELLEPVAATNPRAKFYVAKVLVLAKPPLRNAKRAKKLLQEVVAPYRGVTLAPDFQKQVDAFLEEQAITLPEIPEPAEGEDVADAASRLDDPEAAGDPELEPAPEKAAPLYTQAKALWNERNFAAAFAPMKQAAELGYVAAMVDLAEMYQASLGTTRDVLKAEYWYQKAAATGDPHGKTRLAIAYQRHDSGLPFDPWLSRKIYEELGDASAIRLLDNDRLGQGPRPPKAEREAAAARKRGQYAAFAAQAALKPPAPAPVKSGLTFPIGTQFRANTPHVAYKVSEYFEGDKLYKLIHRKPLADGGFELLEAYAKESELSDRSKYQRAEEVPWCTRCGGKGRRHKVLYPERKSGYFLAGTGTATVFRSKQEQEWEDRQCPQCKGDGLSH